MAFETELGGLGWLLFCSDKFDPVIETTLTGEEALLALGLAFVLIMLLAFAFATRLEESP